MSISTQTWQKILAQAISDPAELCRILELDPDIISGCERSEQQFRMRVPTGFVSRMEKGNPHDPLLLQVLPLAIEMQTVSGFNQDPVGELSASPVSGLLHKYHGRVLLTLTGACAVNCRYCFRRHYPYDEKVPGLSQWEAALDYIAADSSITEVILSGGDPLIVKDQQLAQLITSLEKITHLKTLRIHTRLPIMIPERMTKTLIDLLKQSRLRAVMVLHSNHANEIDDSVSTAIVKCQDAGLIVLNQAVLLKNVNDSVDALVQLSERLFEVGVLPYYLHVLDPVAGAAHFDIDKEKAKQLVGAMSDRLPGYLVPKLVQEIEGLGAKQLL
jgi:L-lysine 2,3-aminomutase